MSLNQERSGPASSPPFAFTGCLYTPFPSLLRASKRDGGGRAKALRCLWVPEVVQPSAGRFLGDEGPPTVC